MTFSPAVSYDVGSNPVAVVTEDFDGDGNLDVASANQQGHNVSVILGNGTGGFARAPDSPTGLNPSSMAVGDFNRDGRADLVTMNESQVSVLLGNGNGTFQPPANTVFNDASALASVAVGDFNDDGNMDLGVVSNLYVFDGCNDYGCYGHHDGFAKVLFGNGSGTFSEPVSTFLGSGLYHSIALADFNGEGKLDLASINLETGNVVTMLGDGNGSFGSNVFYYAEYPNTVTVGNINSDGKIDLIASSNYRMSTLLGNGLGAFAPAQYFSGGPSPLTIAIADFNGDGKTDISTTNLGVGNVSVMLNNGAGSFTLPVSNAAGLQPTAVATGDFNQDGRFDVVATSGASNSVAVLLNDAVWPALNAPNVSLGDVTVTEGNTGITVATFVLSLSATYNQNVSVDFRTKDGTAVAGSDYQSQTGTVTFTPGQTSKSISVLVTGDRIGEQTEQLTVVLSNPTNAFLSKVEGVGTIVDDEPFVSLEGDVGVTEGNVGSKTLVFSATLSAVYDAPVTVEYFTSNLSDFWTYEYGYSPATAGVDYLASSGIVTIAAGQTSQTFTVPINGDRISEQTEYFQMEIRNPVGALLSSSFVFGSIVDDEPIIRLVGTNVIEENSGSKTLPFTLSLSNAYDIPVTVDFATSDFTASAGSDYVAASGTVTFAAGQTVATIPVAVKGDTVAEADEYFSMGLSNPTNSGFDYGWPTASADGGIIDDDTPPTISINGGGILEGNSGTRSLVFTVNLSQISTRTIQVSFATSNGTATTSDRDYVARSGTLSFAPGELSKTISITIQGDKRRESDEFFYVRLSRPVNGFIESGEATGWIWNDDGGRNRNSLSSVGAVDAVFEEMNNKRLKKRGR